VLSSRTGLPSGDKFGFSVNYFKISRPEFMRPNQPVLR
jgi:hypothetical protein